VGEHAPLLAGREPRREIGGVAGFKGALRRLGGGAHGVPGGPVEPGERAHGVQQVAPAQASLAPQRAAAFSADMRHEFEITGERVGHEASQSGVKMMFAVTAG